MNSELDGIAPYSFLRSRKCRFFRHVAINCFGRTKLAYGSAAGSRRNNYRSGKRDRRERACNRG